MSDRAVDLVVGGGAAGIAAAVRLTEMGRAPLLVEKRPWLGGRATSFVSRETGEWIDNGQHVILGCCRNILKLLEALGTQDLVRFSSTINWAMADGATAHLKRSPLPAPLHYMPSLFRLKTLTFRERLSLMRAQSAIYFTSESKRLSLRAMTFDQWLTQHGQSTNVRVTFWEPIVLSALNEPMNECSASAAIDLFQRAFLPSRKAATIGVPTVSLRELIGDPAQRYLTTHGGEVRVGVGLQSLQLSDGRVSQVTLTNNATVDVRSVTLAVPAQQLAPLLPDSVRDSMPSLPIWRDDKGSPIICIHLWFKEPVTSLPHAILRNGLPQWFFAHPVSAEVTERTGATQRLVAVISVADAAMGLSNDKIVSQTMETLQSALPQSRSTLPIFSRVVREPRATFTLTTQTEHHRVSQGTNIPNLHLAGDWTDSGWPATLEGAVASAQRIAF